MDVFHPLLLDASTLTEQYILEIKFRLNKKLLLVQKY